MKNKLFFYLLLFASSLSLAQNSGDNLFDDSYIHEIRVTFFIEDFFDSLESDYDKLMRNDFQSKKEYLPALIKIDGIQLDTIGFREKGFFSNWGIGADTNSSTNIAYKKPFKIDINEFKKKQKYDGIKKINLQNCAMDPSVMRDKLSYNILRTAEVKAPRSAYVKLYLNNRYWGLYLMVEQIDKTFLKNNFANGKGNLYKCIDNTDLSWLGKEDTSYSSVLEKKTNKKKNNWNDLIHLLKVINKVSVSEIEDSLNAIFNITDFYKSMAIDIILNNWDSYFDHGRNFFLYNEPESHKFNWIHWDYNLSFSATKMHLFPSIQLLATISDGNSTPSDTLFIPKEKPLEKVIYNNPNFRLSYLKVFSKILSENFTHPRLNEKINILKKLIQPAIKIDTNYHYANAMEIDLTLKSVDLFKNGVLELEQYIETRIVEVKEEVDSLIEKEKHKDIFINEIMTVNKSIVKDENGEYENWLELYNSTDSTISLKTFYLSIDTKQPKQWVLPDTNLKSQEYLIIWLDGETEDGKLHTNFKLSATDNNRIQLLNQKNDTTLVLVNSITLPQIMEDKSFGRKKENPLEWTYFDLPTPNQENSRTTSVVNINQLPNNFELLQNYPNPFNPTTVIKYQIPNIKNQVNSSSQNLSIVSLKVYNLLGKEIATLVKQKQSQGNYKVQFNANNLPSGVYFYRITVGNISKTKQMIFVK